MYTGTRVGLNSNSFAAVVGAQVPPAPPEPPELIDFLDEDFLDEDFK